jgi:hypothetical protein
VCSGRIGTKNLLGCEGTIDGIAHWFMVWILANPLRVQARSLQTQGNHYPENYILRLGFYFPCFNPLVPFNKVGQALGRLVTLGCTLTLRGASTYVLSTRWSSWVLTRYNSMGFLILGWASYLYAFSTYPLRTQLPCVYHWRDNRYTGGSFVPVLSY